MNRAFRRCVMFYCLLCLTSAVLLGCQSDEDKMFEIKVATAAGEYEKARSLTYRYFKNDDAKYVECMLYIYRIQHERREEEYTDSLVVQDSWTWKVDGDYIYIDGRVRNDGTGTVTYFKLSAEFYNDALEVVDTDWTNSSDRIRPGAAKSFDMMHRYAPDIKRARVYVSEVVLESKW